MHGRINEMRYILE
jgi:hypothetical protein